MNKQNPVTVADLTDLDPKALRKLEMEVARRHVGQFPWASVVWGVVNTLAWLALWPLVLLGILPLWIGFLIATVNITLAYLPSHEAQHDILWRPDSRWHWLNDAFGSFVLIPLASSFRALKHTHMQHHRHTNDPNLDPDYSTKAPGPWAHLWGAVLNRQPRAEGGFNAYGACLERLGRGDVIVESIVYQLGYFGILFTLAWSGYALEAALLWWLPRHLGLTYIYFFLSWAPHHPAQSQDRYGDTRAWRSTLGNIGSLGMQYHIVHHLHPRIPLFRTGPAYWEMRDVLQARGCDLGRL